MSKSTETTEDILREMQSMGNYQSFSGDHAARLAHRIRKSMEGQPRLKDCKSMLERCETLLGRLIRDGLVVDEASVECSELADAIWDLLHVEEARS